MTESKTDGEGERITPAAADLSPSKLDARPIVLCAEEILQGRREIWLDYRGEVYRLRVTSSGKLYLSK